MSNIDKQLGGQMESSAVDYDAKRKELEELGKADLGSLDEDGLIELAQRKKALKAELGGVEGEAHAENIEAEAYAEDNARRAAEFEKVKAASEAAAQEKLAELRAQMGIGEKTDEVEAGETVENIDQDREDAEAENVERDFDKLDSRYIIVEDKIGTEERRYAELIKQSEDLHRERQKAEESGDKNKSEEIATKIKENKRQRMLIERGEKLTEIYERDADLVNQARAVEGKIDSLWAEYRAKHKDKNGDTKRGSEGEMQKYYEAQSPLFKELDAIKIERKKLEEEAQKQASPDNWNENGLDGAKRERRKIVAESVELSYTIAMAENARRDRKASE